MYQAPHSICAWICYKAEPWLGHCGACHNDGWCIDNKTNYGHNCRVFHPLSGNGTMEFPNATRSMGHNWYILSYRHNAFYKVGRMFQQIFHIFSHHYLNSPKCNQTEIQNLSLFPSFKMHESLSMICIMPKKLSEIVLTKWSSLQFFGSPKWFGISNDKDHLQCKLRFNGHSQPIRLNLTFALLVPRGIDIPTTVRKRPRDIGYIDHLLWKYFIST